MASSKICIVIAIAAVFAPSILATEFMIGDETGWTTNFDYQAWAYGKEFHVGDKLGKSFHNYRDICKYDIFLLIGYIVECP